MLVVSPPILTPVLVSERSNPIIFDTFLGYYIAMDGIFVLIPSFQEEDLVKTVDSIFARIGFTDNGVNDLVSSTLSQNQWYFASETFDGTNHRLYINGILDKTSSVSGKTILDDGFSLTINSYSGSAEFLAGRTSLIHYYNRALSAQEILQNYNATKGRYR
jgi:hypothetical protein